MKKMIYGWLAVVLTFASVGSLAAHHSLAQFDTTTAVSVKGAIARIELINPHSLIFVDQKRADGQVQHWIVEGPGITQLTRSGISKVSMKVGDVIEACGYVLKEGADSPRYVGELAASDSRASPLKAAGKLMDAETIVMPGGEKQKWSDYGHHLCLGPEYQDFHK